MIVFFLISPIILRWMLNFTYSQATSGRIGADVCSAGKHVVFRTIGRSATRLKTESQSRCSGTCQGDATVRKKKSFKKILFLHVITNRQNILKVTIQFAHVLRPTKTDRDPLAWLRRRYGSVITHKHPRKPHSAATVSHVENSNALSGCLKRHVRSRNDLIFCRLPICQYSNNTQSVILNFFK